MREPYNSLADLALGRELIATHYPELQILQATVIQGGGIKTIWKVETQKGTVCLKRIRKSIPVVHFTTAAQEYLASNGALVAKIIRTKTNERYFVHEGYALVLYEWIEGTDLDMEENQADLEHGLAGLARFQLRTKGFVPPEGSQVYDRMGVWPKHYEQLLQELKEWQQTAKQAAPNDFYRLFLEYIDEMINLGERASTLLAQSSYTKWVANIGKHGYMCHQDYGKGNALLTEQGVYVLDLDNLTYDLPIRDVRKLISKRMDEVGVWDQKELEQLISVYTAEFPLTPEQLHILYIDLLFPHQFHGVCKNVFKKGKPGEVKKLQEGYLEETAKLATLNNFLHKK